MQSTARDESIEGSRPGLPVADESACFHQSPRRRAGRSGHPLSESDLEERAVLEAGERFFYGLPYRPNFADEFPCPTLQWATRAEAINHRYVQPHFPRRVSALWFDHDGRDARIAHELAGLPEPSIRVLDRVTGRGHLAYQLETPVLTGRKARTSPRKLLHDVGTAYTRMLGADPAFNARMVKNPFHSDYDVLWSGSVFSLTYLAEWIERDTSSIKPFKGKIGNANPDANSREHRLWDGLCRWAYCAVHSSKSAEDFRAAAEVEAFRIASGFDLHHPHEFTAEEVISKADRVANWTWEKRAEIRMPRNRGVLRLPPIPRLEKKAFWKVVRLRQATGARYTARQKSTSTRDEVASAVRELHAVGLPVTVPAIMHLTKRCRNTVRKYMRQLERLRAAGR